MFQVAFRIILAYETKIRKKKKEKVLATAFLNLSDICQSGNINSVLSGSSNADNQGSVNSM